ncbi:PLP-dependent aminotransferase family protein [Bacillus sp. JJ722]|uniref:MocR-like pyridoxine biosynthesis transcription factor PdxR n=1 Tax=Bacillus sp. JJ722 TaxID=3122973 RepID=UPI002FFE17D2
MQIVLNRNSTITLIQQIHESISDRIRSGILEIGSQLPSIRELAKQLGVSMVTVSKAYTLLEREGLITRIRGKGTFVYRETGNVNTEDDNPYAWQLTIDDYLPRSSYLQSQYEKAQYQFASSKIEPTLFPNLYIEKEVNKVIREQPSILSTYGNAVQGDVLLRKEMARYLKKVGIHSNFEEILITNGAQQAIDLVARTFVGPGDVVITEAPTYSAAIDVFRGRGATVLAVPLDENGMQVDYLESICLQKRPKVIYTNPTFQNPTGTVLSQNRREKLVSLAEEYNIIIIEDDSWSDMYFGKEPPAPIKSNDNGGHVVYVKGFSKTFMPGCRIAALVANRTLFNRLVASKSIADLGSPLITQKILLPLLTSERIKQHTEKLRIALAIRCDMVDEILREYAPKEITWAKPSGGLNLWIGCPYWFHTDKFLIEAQRKGLSFLPSSACYPGEPEYNYMRICFSYMSEKHLEEGLKLLCILLHEALLNKEYDRIPII